MSNKINRQKLKEACEDILYGIVALDYACEKCLSPHISNTDKKFFLDSFIIHFRALYHFFYGRFNKKYPEDNLAMYYLQNYQNFKDKSTKESLFKFPNGRSYIDKANIQLAHLSLKRRDDDLRLENEGGWPVKDMKDKLDITMKAFFECLPEPKKSWFKELEDAGLDDLPIPSHIKMLYN